MKRKAVLALFAFILFLLQTTIFRNHGVTNVIPNLILVITVAVGFMQGKKEGIMMGFFCGALVDVMYSDVLGYQALLFLLIGYLAGCLCQVFFADDLKVPVLMALVADILYNLGVYVTRFLIKGNTEIVFYMRHMILPEAVATAIAMLLLYKLLYAVNHAMVEKEKESKQSLWIRG